MILAGEASGDLNGARLAAELKEMLGDVDLFGVGGAKMRQAGVKLLYDSSAWSAIGIAEAVKIVPRLLPIAHKLRARLRQDTPDLLILIDFGAFNLCVARNHPGNLKVLYYFPPSSWKRGAKYSKLCGVVDRVVAPFPWTVDALRDQGFDADFFGHPLLDVVKPSTPRDEFFRTNALQQDKHLVGLLPGSRKQEILNNLPALVVAAGRMLEANGDLQFAIPLAPSVSEEMVAMELGKLPWVAVQTSRNDGESHKAKISSLPLADRVRELASHDGFIPPKRPIPIAVLPGMAHDVLAYSRAAAVTSGTATVEAAILGCPMVIFYRGNRITELEYNIRCRNIKFVGAPNIILDRLACPELLGRVASPERIYFELMKLIEETPERAEMLRSLQEVKAVLGSPGAVKRTAEVVLELLGIEKLEIS
jgi:lipid-A-disaccharide synthase